MKLKFAALGFGASLVVTLAAQAGTIGVFRVADDQIVAVSSDGAQILVEKEAFGKIKSKAKQGDKVVLDGTQWTLAKNAGKASKLQVEGAESEFVDILPAE